ncbi:MAG: phosphocholine cytidylyltransferase family protein [Deltaproteobacteria bacterium]|nr:phosphocholine cytidylyltransferase family protein [Deltaproteobacteria bacterium]
MRAIIIGAGRGRRLMPYTADMPKCYAAVGGRRLLDWGLEALEAGGLERVVFIGGYCIDQVQRDYPHFTFCHNDDWPNNNIMRSLMYAEEHMDDGFVCSYADILYRPEIVERLVQSPYPITLVCDTAWRRRYEGRTEHPEHDAEKMTADEERVVRLGRTIPSEHARGEYIGVARFTAEGAALLKEHYRRASERYGEGPFQGAASFRKAYLIDLLQEMLDAGVAMHLLETAGGYMEIDTTQDYHLACTEWGRP